MWGPVSIAFIYLYIISTLLLSVSSAGHSNILLPKHRREAYRAGRESRGKEGEARAVTFCLWDWGKVESSFRFLSRFACLISGISSLPRRFIWFSDDSSHLYLWFLISLIKLLLPLSSCSLWKKLRSGFAFADEGF